MTHRWKLSVLKILGAKAGPSHNQKSAFCDLEKLLSFWLAGRYRLGAWLAGGAQLCRLRRLI